MTADAIPLLDARQLAIARGGQPLLAGIDIRLGAGSLLWLRGRNGRGKTSLLRVLAGLASPEAGQVKRSGPLLWLSHRAAVKDELTVDENLAFMARLHGWVADAALRRRALAHWGLAALARRPARSLSQGQRRRVALARLALAPQPGLWLLDEPADALDDDGARCLAASLDAHALAGGAALWSSHGALPASQPVAGVIDLDATDFDPAGGRR